jgi:hypothetical protein
VNWEAIRHADIEVMVLAGDLEAAQKAVERLPAATPFECYLKAEHEALVRYETTGETDRSAVRAALAAIPPGPDQVHAVTNSAIDDARKLLPDGDWRAPLVAVRDTIPEGDARILVRDHGWSPFTVVLVKSWPALVVLVGLTVGIGHLRALG